MIPSALAPFMPQIIASAQPVAELSFTAGDDLLPWQSKLGGTPYLPLSMPYPHHPHGRPLALFIQINFAEMPPLPGYPQSGILQVYADSQDDSGYGLLEEEGHRIIYHAEVSHDRDLLHRAFPPISFAEYFAVQASHAIHYHPALHYINRCDYHFADICDANGRPLAEEDALMDAYREFLGPDRSIGGHIGGYPVFNQYDPRGEVDVPGERFRDYVLLLQLFGRDPALGGHYVSCNFFIHPEDLRNRDFSKVYSNMDAD